MATKKTDKYADYRYQIESEAEMAEALWQIEQGDYKDLDDYINCYTRSEKRRFKRMDAEKEKRARARKTRRIETMKKDKAA